MSTTLTGIDQRGSAGKIATALRRWLPSHARGWQHFFLIALLLALQLAGAVLAPWGAAPTTPFWDFLCAAAIGATLAPPTLLALWAVFGPGQSAVRLPLLAWFAGAYYVALLFGECQSNGGPDDYTYIGEAPWLASFVMMLLPLGLLRRIRHWRLMLIGDRSEMLRATPGGGLSGSQFTVRALMGWTLASAVLLAATKSLIVEGTTERIGLLADAWNIALTGSLISLAGLSVVPVAWILLANGRRPLLRTVLAALLLAGSVGGVLLLVHSTTSGGDWKQLVSYLSGTLVNGMGTLAVFGTCGYRLVRGPELAAHSLLPQETIPPPLSRTRFLAAIAPLAAIGVAMACAVPHQLREWRKGTIFYGWEKRGLWANFDEAGNVESLKSFKFASLPDETLLAISQLATLTYLDLSSSPIDDRLLSFLAPLKGLRSLNICHSAVTDDGLRQLLSLTNLEVLGIPNSQITDAGLSHLTGLPTLSVLDLSVTNITDAGLMTLAGLPRLFNVDVTLTAVSEAGAEQFRTLRPNIKLEGGASDADVARWIPTRTTAGPMPFVRVDHGPPSLKRLHLRGRKKVGNAVANLTDAALPALAAYDELEDLDLRETAVTDQGIQALAALKRLKHLDLRGTNVTEHAVSRLAAVLPACRILR